MQRGKNFSVYLIDGEVTGSIKCNLANWTGLAFKIPRTHLEKFRNRQDLKQSGVYFLFGKNEEGKDEVYVGQAGNRKNGEGILLRILEHVGKDFYFSDAVIFTTQNNYFGPTEISYLENMFTRLAKENDRYIVRNGNEPNAGNVTEEKESELIDFIEYSKMVLGVLGYKIFAPLVKKEVQVLVTNTDETMLYLKRKVKNRTKLLKLHASEPMKVL